MDNCKRSLEDQVTLAHGDTEKLLYVYTDECDSVWSGVVTQVPYENLSQSHIDQCHEPLGFLSEHFPKSRLLWSTFQKKLLSFMATTDRMHWILATTEESELYTDHLNLIFSFDPLGTVLDLAASSLRKVPRWAFRLSM